MYILEFLSGLTGKDDTSTNGIKFEYRLLCSGELYNAKLSSGWRKDTWARILLGKPFLLSVCSQRFDDYPQELALRFRAERVRETRGKTTYDFYPDEEIARDIAALLSLLLRRLITIAAKVREIHPRIEFSHEQELFIHTPSEFLTDIPLDFVKRLTPIFWK